MSNLLHYAALAGITIGSMTSASFADPFKPLSLPVLIVSAPQPPPPIPNLAISNLQVVQPVQAAPRQAEPAPRPAHGDEQPHD